MNHLRTLLLLALVSLPIPSVAYELRLVEPEQPYQPVNLTLVEDATLALDVLEGYPTMYELTLVEPTSLPLTLLQKYNGREAEIAPLSLMVVRRTDRGVEEVLRTTGADAASWEMASYPELGLTLLESAHSLELTPGTYRIEVSTPVNEGRYALILGEESTSGYFGTLATIRQTQKHFGYSFVKMLQSPYVYYPLGIILLIGLFERTWRYRKKIINAR